jgi:hypothetical protein
MAVLLIFILPRKYVVVPFLFVSLFIPFSQVLVVAGLHFQVTRIILPLAWARALWNQLSAASADTFRLNGIDKAVILWGLTDAVCATLLWGSWGAFVNRLGSLYNVFGIYFLLRLLIRDRDDVNRVIRTLAVAFVLIGVFMVREQITGQNIFSVFGMSPYTNVREGRIRSQAVFAHAILAGTVGATMLPLWIGFWGKGKKLISTLGVMAALIMTIFSASATPIGACLAGLGALCMWPLRRSMRLCRWTLVVLLLGLHLVMKAPVWALIARINFVGGNSGYHRYELVNDAITHFGEWWLVGTKNPGSWGFETWDLSNAFVNVAVDGGLFALIFYLAIFWQAFRQIGLARSAAEKDQRRDLAFQQWSFGCALFATVIGFFGIYYFDQSILIWYLLMAMISAITALPAVNESVEWMPSWLQASTVRRLQYGASFRGDTGDHSRTYTIQRTGGGKP